MGLEILLDFEILLWCDFCVICFSVWGWFVVGFCCWRWFCCLWYGLVCWLGLLMKKLLWICLILICWWCLIFYFFLVWMRYCLMFWLYLFLCEIGWLDFWFLVVLFLFFMYLVWGWGLCVAGCLLDLLLWLVGLVLYWERCWFSIGLIVCSWNCWKLKGLGKVWFVVGWCLENLWLFLVWWYWLFDW